MLRFRVSELAEKARFKGVLVAIVEPGIGMHRGDERTVARSCSRRPYWPVPLTVMLPVLELSFIS